MIKPLSFLLSFCVLSFSYAQESGNDLTTDTNDESAQQYVMDDLFIYIHAGPGREYRITGSITAGSAIEVLQVDDSAGFSEVIDERQRSGWVESKFVTSEPSIRVNVSNLQQQISDLEQQSLDKDDELFALQSEIERGNSMRTQLEEQIASLQTENQQLSARRDENEVASQKEWFMYGGGVAAGGVLLGMIITLILKRRKRSEQWM